MKKVILLVTVILLAFGGYLFLVPREKEIKEVPEEKLEIRGSDTLLQLVANLVEAYTRENPGAKILVAGGGSGTGIAALIDGTADIANSSRSLEEKEILLLKQRGIEYFEIIPGRDALSIVVHPENPVESLTLEEIAKIYRGEITNWKEVGGKNQEITLYGRTGASGTYIHFRDNILKGDYSLAMRQMGGNQAIINSVMVDKSGIGYVGLGYLFREGKPIEEVKALKVAGVSPFDQEAVKEGKYPSVLARPLYQFIAGKPEPGSLAYRFIEFALSEKGEEIVIATGFLPPFPEDREKNQKIFEL